MAKIRRSGPFTIYQEVDIREHSFSFTWNYIIVFKRKQNCFWYNRSHRSQTSTVVIPDWKNRSLFNHCHISAYRLFGITKKFLFFSNIYKNLCRFVIASGGVTVSARYSLGYLASETPRPFLNSAFLYPTQPLWYRLLLFTI